MSERALILLALAALLLAGWALWRGWRRAQLRHVAGVAAPAPLVSGRPGVVAFSTPTCAVCHTRQAPALEELRAALGERIMVQALPALEHPELVSQWGILTVPATVVLDATGTVRHLNLGFASQDTLRQQVEPLLAA